MRSIVTLCLLLAAIPVMAQPPPANSKPVDETTLLLTCSKSAVNRQPPLYVLDGLLVEPDNIKSIDPAMIESVTILKNDDISTVSCSRNTSGIIVITTKKRATFSIKDTPGAVIPLATVRFISLKNNTIKTYSADDAGKLYATDLIKDEEYQVEFSSVGYKPLSLHYKHELKQFPQEIILQKNEVSCLEVVIVAYKKSRGCRDWTICTTTKTEAPVVEPTTKIIVYPNPLPGGNDINVTINTAEQQAARIRIHGRDGKLVWERSVQTVKGPNRFTVNTDSRWAAGVYFLQWVDIKKKIIKTEQFFIY